MFTMICEYCWGDGIVAMRYMTIDGSDQGYTIIPCPCCKGERTFEV